jgi:uncharacterized membrane protein YGL010W
VAEAAPAGAGLRATMDASETPRKIDELFTRYGESHRNPTNKTIHWICVPLITWSLLAALWAWTPLAAYAMIALAVAFYAWLSLPIAVGMLVVSALMVWPLTQTSGHVLTIAIVVFVIAWIGQFIGHRIEGKKPSFFEDIKFLLIGPAWLLGFVYRKLGIAY